MKKQKTQKHIVLDELVSNPFIKKVKKVKNLSAVISNLRKDGVKIVVNKDYGYALHQKNSLLKLEKLIIKYSK